MDDLCKCACHEQGEPWCEACYESTHVVAPGEAQRCEYCGPNCYGGAGHNARVEARDKEYPSAVPSEAQRETLADICPSCGSTDKNERAVCANRWHAVPSEVAPSREQKLEDALRTIAEEDSDCGCDHTTEDCCVLVGVFCPHCIAELALEAK